MLTGTSDSKFSTKNLQIWVNKNSPYNSVLGYQGIAESTVRENGMSRSIGRNGEI